MTGDAGTYHHLPFCAVARIRSGLRIPRAAGAYQDIRANTEQTSMRTGLDHHGLSVWGMGGLASSAIAEIDCQQAGQGHVAEVAAATPTSSLWVTSQGFHYGPLPKDVEGPESTSPCW